MTEPIDFETGSGNVLADLGLPDATMHQLKARLVSKISTVMQEGRLTEKQTADCIGMNESTVAGVLRGRFRHVSVERLLRSLVALGQDVEIVVTPRHDCRTAAIRVV